MRSPKSKANGDVEMIEATIVTGAGSGIGQAVALELARQGVLVILIDWNSAGLDQTKEGVKGLGAECHSTVLDITDSVSIKKAIDGWRAENLVITGLVNCAGLYRFEVDTSVHLLPESVWHETISVNLTGTYLMCHHVVPEMLAAGHGAIVNFSSVAGLVSSSQHAYSASKGGVISLSRSIAGAYGLQKIRCNVICPGPIATPMLDSAIIDGKLSEKQAARIPVGRLGTPLEIAKVAVFLLSSGIDFLTGAVIPVDGGLTAANAALDALDITRYADKRSEVLPVANRGASVLSPYIRHNLLTLDQVYRAVKDAPFKDREKFRDELFWQEYARHLYARIGTRLFENLRYETNSSNQGDGWNRQMRCVDTVLSELESDGWLVNQSRMWMASQWTVRADKGWLHGQERMYRELIDGSRAANLLGWQWTVGAGTGKPYGFARWQVEKRAPGLCMKCPLKKACPIQEFPDEIAPHQLDKDPILDRDLDTESTTGPSKIVKNGVPKFVLLTVDSMGDDDPALAGNPELPVVFVFNKEALHRMQLSSRRIGFYLQTLRDLSSRKDLRVFLGDPYVFAAENDVAVTYAPVPSFKKFTKLAEVHPYPWFRRPHAGSVRSFTSWRQKLES